MTNSATTEDVWGPLLMTWVLGFFTGAVRAAVWMKGWEWFVADTFGVQELSFWQTYGLSLIVSFAVLQLKVDDDAGKGVNRPYFRAGVILVTSLILSGLYFVCFAVIASFL